MITREVDAWGRTVVPPDSVIELMMQGADVADVLVPASPLIDAYNEWCREFDKPEFFLKAPDPMPHSPEEEHAMRSKTWFISDDMQQIDVRSFLLEVKCQDQVCRDRVNLEMDMFEERGLTPLLQLMMFLVDHFLTNKIVWGVGRGSSVASYVLYLIGVHKIDPIKYGLDVHDFLKSGVTS